MATNVRCPTCGKSIQWTDAFPYRPFCCERCRLIDLGKWADESHRIPGPDVPPDTPSSPLHEDS